MFDVLSRRKFVAGSVTASLAGLVDLPFLNRLPTEAAVAPVPKRLVALNPDIEPLVRQIEDTPRERILAWGVAQIRAGYSYEQLLGALFLAGVRGIQPRPVGFKFHAVLVVNSAHQASMAAADRDRWLPLLWALDYFKGAQQTNRTQGDWRMAPAADEATLPSADSARAHLSKALDNWEVDATDRAVSALARSAGLNEIFELLWFYGARDFRAIGHKAIYVANAFRTLQVIGARHAEPVLRSVAYALLDHEGTNPAKRDDSRDQPGRENIRLARENSRLGIGGRADDSATRALLSTLRTGSAREGSRLVLELWRKGVNNCSVWDGLFLGAGELLMRQPGIVGLHCVTTINALHFAYQTSASADTRRFVTLQGAAFLPLFREAMLGRGQLQRRFVDMLEPEEFGGMIGPRVEEIFGNIGAETPKAAAQMLGLLEKKPEALPQVMAAARRLVFAKGRDSHDYKFSSAALEDYFHISPAWRARFAATSVFHLRGGRERDNDLIRRAREMS